MTAQEQPIGNGAPVTGLNEIYKGASILILSAEEKKALAAPVNEEDVDIRKDGLVYLPQVYWREILNNTFGIAQWAIIPVRDIKEVGKLNLECVLMIRGHYVSTSMGEAEMDTGRFKSYATVWEAAKSDGITRCCKDLGIAKELWEPQFIALWKQEYALQVWVRDNGREKQVWRKKEGVKFPNEIEPPKEGELPPASPTPPASAYNQSKKPSIASEGFKKACDRLRSGEIKVYASMLEYFSIDHAQMNELTALFKTVCDQIITGKIQANIGESTPENPPEDMAIARVIAVWSGKLDRCKSPSDLTLLYENNRHTIDANIEIKKLFTQRQAALNNKTK